MFSYFTDLQGSQTVIAVSESPPPFSYFTDLQGSQTDAKEIFHYGKFSYFTDLQGSQTVVAFRCSFFCLVTLLIYKVLKPNDVRAVRAASLVTLLIYKVLKPQILVITEPSILAYV